MTTKKEKELAAFHARQALRNKNAVPVDSIFERKSFKPAMPEEDNPSGYDVTVRFRSKPVLESTNDWDRRY